MVILKLIMMQRRGLMATLKPYYETMKRAHGSTKTLLRNNEEGSWLLY